MSSRSRRTMIVLAAAAFAGSYCAVCESQPKEPRHGAAPSQNAAPAVHPGMRAPSNPAVPPRAQPPTALPEEGGPPSVTAGPHWHGDISQFRQHDMRVWQGGHWRHQRHGGRLGWWWVVGGLWYYYPEPVYPYPDPFAPPLAGRPLAGGRYWYYCQSAEQYYPYATACPEGWRPVPAL